LGKWYEIERYDFSIRENADCIKTVLQGNDSNLHGQDTGRNIWETKDYNKKFTAVEPIAGQPKLKYWFEGNSEPADTNYSILDTDYTTYSVVWGCVNKTDGNSTEYYTTLSRTKELTKDRLIRKKIMTIIDDAEIDVRFIRITRQDSEVCP